MVLIEIPPRESLVRTHDDDPVDWYYRPIVGRLYLRRLEMVLSLLDTNALAGSHRVLEVGFGSGFFFPSLNRHFTHVHGVDLHSQVATVRRRLLEHQRLASHLATGSAYQLPYRDRAFDCVIAVSLLEHLEYLDLAIEEMARVATDTAPIVVGFPTRNLLMHVLFRLMLLGRSDAEFHVSSHHDIFAALERHLMIDDVRVMPAGAPFAVAVYIACKCRRK